MSNHAARKPRARRTTTEPEEAWIYLRISVGSDLATERQLAQCQASAEARGLPVTATYSDEGVSAYDGSERPGFDSMISDAIAAAIEGRRVLLIAWDLDRLVRRVSEVGRLIGLFDQYGIPFATVAGGVDLTSPAGVLIVYILTAVAEMESAHKAERMRLRFDQDRDRGNPHWSFRPFGFAKGEHGWEHHPTEAATLRELYARFNGGESIRSLTLWLNAEGITQPERKRKTGETIAQPWTAARVGRLLRADRNVGLIRSSIPELADATYPGAWEPIVDAETFARAARALSTNTAARNAGGLRRSHLLSGLLICDHCGGRMAIAPKGGKHGYANYKCRKDPAGGHVGCGRTVSQKHADAIVSAAVLDWLDNPENVAALTLPDDHEDAAELADTIAKATERRAHLVAKTDPDLPADVRWSDEEIAPEMAKLAVRIREANDALRKARAAAPLGEEIEVDGLRERWESGALDIEGQRAVIVAVLEPVRIRTTAKAGRGFDASRVDWRYRYPSAA